ncbi:hypothetical protein [Nocardia sp. XZ_19_231]|uniref:hypothetical protein n=1 Tax=Nocardia sp. XZ_19_231 TaxID=2769252 RepID=UPI0018904973|nr:hypothetical protein [Nocardia sp. XZ_19_231]
MTTLPDFGGSTADRTVIATAYAAFFGGLLLFGARVGQRVGHRHSILGSIALFAMAVKAPRWPRRVSTPGSL